MKQLIKIKNLIIDEAWFIIIAACILGVLCFLAANLWPVMMWVGSCFMIIPALYLIGLVINWTIVTPFNWLVNPFKKSDK